jgi:hypothetical protein
VDDFVDIINEYTLEKKYKFKVIKIYSEVDKDIVKNALAEGKVSPCGAVAEVNEFEVTKATRIVAQMGMEPLLEAIKEHPYYDIIIAGRAYDPSPYTAYCYSNCFTDLGNIYHMGRSWNVVPCAVSHSQRRPLRQFGKTNLRLLRSIHYLDAQRNRWLLILCIRKPVLIYWQVLEAYWMSPHQLIPRSTQSLVRAVVQHSFHLISIQSSSKVLKLAAIEQL